MALIDVWNKIKTDPFSILGMHKDEKSYFVRILNHHAEQARLENLDTHNHYILEKNEEGLFFCRFDHPISNYQIEFKREGVTWKSYDPYFFPPILTDHDLYLFSEGTHRRIWEMMGSHPLTFDGISGVFFSIWAPNAYSVRVTGEFNFWDQERHFMRSRGNTGVWELFIPGIDIGQTYKYVIETKDQRLLEKSDPYAFYAEKRPRTASLIYDISGFKWDDSAWMEKRTQNFDKPLSIYECHLDTWLKKDNEISLSYQELAELLSEYLILHGFTHLELMPITEYPYDASWGYQVTGYYAPTSRYGTPHDFMSFVNIMHQKGIGVIIDWVPAHFPNDSHGLAQFDGTALYEHEDPKLGWHQDWATHIFNFGRTEVRQFLIGSALYWLENYHIDGIRVDAVASMLYLDYSRTEGDWIPNKYGGRHNLEAIEFLQSLNTEIGQYYPNVMTIAEESTSFDNVTAPTFTGGLGFTYKWNMGWMNDTLRYFTVDPLFRPWHHNELTFSLIYSFSENFILPFSHDEVVHGKKTLLNRMPGSDWEKFANLRLMYAYMWCHPGKKLLFSGQEWGPWQEWNEKNVLAWDLNKYSLHKQLRILVADLNKIYLSESALFEIDQNPETFFWIDCDNRSSGILMWVRSDSQGNKLLIILNLNTVMKENFRVGVPEKAGYKEILNTDNANYGGAHIINLYEINSEEIPYQNQQYSIIVSLGPLSAVIFKIYPY